MKAELTLCPWCRNETSERVVRCDRVDAWGEIWFGECGCGARGPQAESKEQAMIEWNSWLINTWIFFQKQKANKVEPKT